jgi:hypothetical protein
MVLLKIHKQHLKKSMHVGFGFFATRIGLPSKKARAITTPNPFLPANTLANSNQ